MKNLKNMVAVIMSVVLIFIFIIPYSAESLSTNSTINEYKIDNELKNIVENVSSNETIPVVLWLSDVDNEERSDLISSQIRTAEINGQLSSKIISNTDLTTVEKAVVTNEDLSEQADVLIEIKRDVEKELHSENNSNVLSTLSSSYDIDTEPVFISNYAPLVIIDMTKAQIAEAVNNESIESIYYYNPASVVEEETVSATNSTLNTDLYPYGVWQDIANIKTLRDELGYTGSGIKIGLLGNAVPNFDYEGIDHTDSVELYEQFAYHIENDMLHFPETEFNNAGATNHGNYMLSILSGFTDDYEGVAPLAEIFCEGYYGTPGYFFTPIENLVDYGVNIISASINWGDFGNDYDFVSKYVDYIVSNNDITFCVSAGNNENANSIGATLSAPTAFNVITVGNIDDYGTIDGTDDNRHYTSLYYNSPNTVYKPDICAPGMRASTYVARNIENGGTSAACPIVAGSCALLMEAFPTLQTKPMLLKSLLMASANELETVTDVYSTATSVEPALTRECGPGMVDAYTAYLICENRDYRHYNVPMSNSYDYNIEVIQDDVTSGKDIYLSLNWMQWNTTNGENWGVDSNYNVLDGFHHTLSLYDPDGVLVAVSDYQYDKKQFIRYKPLQAGQYTARTTRTYTGSPAYYPAFAVASCIK